MFQNIGPITYSIRLTTINSQRLKLLFSSRVQNSVKLPVLSSIRHAERQRLKFYSWARENNYIKIDLKLENQDSDIRSPDSDIRSPDSDIRSPDSDIRSPDSDRTINDLKAYNSTPSHAERHIE